MDRRFEDVYRRFGELRSDVDGKLGELKGEMDRRFGELREDISGLREEIKEIRLLLYKVLEVPHKQEE
jgi:hypothetical protein